MNKLQTRTKGRVIRVCQFCGDHADPATATEAAALEVVKTALETAGSTQDGGNGSVTSAVGGRKVEAKQLRTLMLSLAKAARRLDPIAHPDVAGKMRMHNTDSYAKLLTRAHVFKDTLAPIKAEFVTLGAPADVDQELDDLITAVEAAGDRKYTGLDTQVGGTFSIEVKAREAIRIMQKLDAIFTQLYRKNPVLLGQWKVANRATPYSTGVEAAPAAPTTPAAPVAPAAGGNQ